MSQKSCCVPGCQVTTKDGITLHRFPNPETSTENFNIWVSSIGGNIAELDADVVFRNRRVCDKHFEDINKYPKNRLSSTAVPRLHLISVTAAPNITVNAALQSPKPAMNSEAYTSDHHRFVSPVSHPVSEPSVSTPSRACVESGAADTTTHADTQRVLLHRFPNPSNPAQTERFRTWVMKIGGDIIKEDNLYIFRNRKVCHRHFQEEYIFPSMKLSALAIPKLQIPGVHVGPHKIFVPPVEETLTTVQADNTIPLNTDEEMHGVETQTASSAAERPPSTGAIPSIPLNKDEEMHGVETQTASSAAERPPSTGAIPSIPLNKATTEENNNASYWKQKLTHILHSNQFCGICLSTDEVVDTVSDHFEIVVGGTSHSRTLADIIDVVFQETEDHLSNLQICSSCTAKLIQSYTFIQQARARSNMLKYYLNDLYKKTCYIRNNVVKDLPKEHGDVSNVLISIENYDNLNQFQNIFYTKPPKKKVERNRRRLKQSYKCLTCNLFLPSHKAWRVHEITNHRINMSKTQLNSRKYPGQILKRMCRICHKVVKTSELLKHLKKFHRDSLCTVCNVAFNSSEDLEAHKQTWHYRDVGKCFTCLRSYSKAELQQHRCWFSCNVCTEAPCVHHKYLTCYKQQILNGALRAKCLDCQFVCRTKKAYLEHVNMCHLKFSAKSSVKCKVLPNNQYLKMSKSNL